MARRANLTRRPTGARKQEAGEHSMTKRTTTDNPPGDPAQFSLGEIVANLPAVRRAKQVNTMSRVHRCLIGPLESGQDNEAQLLTAIPATACGYGSKNKARYRSASKQEVLRRRRSSGHSLAGSVASGSLQHGGDPNHRGRRRQTSSS